MTPTTFEDRLLDELRAVGAARPAPITSTPARRAPRARLGLAAGAVAATVAGILVASGGNSATPAYAVDRRPDGSVSVEINSLRDAAGLQKKLRAAGIPAVVNYTPMGKTCREPRGRSATPGTPGRDSMKVGVRKDHSATFTIPRGDLRPGQTLVITASTGGSATSIGTAVLQGPIAPCKLVDAPPLPAGGGAGLNTGGAKAGATTHTGP